MKNSIAITLMVIIGIFGLVSGYSIGFKNAGSKEVGRQIPISTTESKAVSGGYGASAGAAEKAGGYGATAGGYGAPAGKAGATDRLDGTAAPGDGQ